MAKIKGLKVETFEALFNRMFQERRFVSVLLTGHLAIEFLLKKLVAQYDPKLTRLVETLRHEPLVKFSADVGIITDPQRNVLLKINTLRNDLAHQLTYEPTIAEIRALLLAASGAFSDLTDGIAQGLDAIRASPEAESLDDIEEWSIGDLFSQISYDLHHVYTDRGGDWDSFTS